jgi:hypothetical protein
MGGEQSTTSGLCPGVPASDYSEEATTHNQAASS